MVNVTMHFIELIGKCAWCDKQSKDHLEVYYTLWRSLLTIYFTYKTSHQCNHYQNGFYELTLETQFAAQKSEMRECDNAGPSKMHDSITSNSCYKSPS